MVFPKAYIRTLQPLILPDCRGSHYFRPGVPLFSQKAKNLKGVRTCQYSACMANNIISAKIFPKVCGADEIWQGSIESDIFTQYTYVEEETPLNADWLTSGDEDLMISWFEHEDTW